MSGPAAEWWPQWGAVWGHAPLMTGSETAPHDLPLQSVLMVSNGWAALVVMALQEAVHQNVTPHLGVCPRLHLELTDGMCISLCFHPGEVVSQRVEGWCTV